LPARLAAPGEPLQAKSVIYRGGELLSILFLYSTFVWVVLQKHLAVFGMPSLKAANPTLPDLHIFTGPKQSTLWIPVSLVRKIEKIVNRYGFLLEFCDVADEQSDKAAVKCESAPSTPEVVKRLKEWF
jgi:hypothetical protein